MRRYAAIVALPVLLLVVAHAMNHWRDGLPSLRGGLIDVDGYTHMLRAKELLRTGDWFDHRIHSGNPPAGDELYWPRPFDLVLLAGAAPLTPFLGFDAALHAWGNFVGPALHLLSFFVLLWAARPLFDDRGLFYLGVLFAFQLFIVHMASVARPDHHALLGLLFAWYLGAGLRLLGADGGARAGLYAALPAVASMWISLESLVITAASFLALGVAWVAVREDFARKGAAFALALAAGFGLSLVAEHGFAGLVELHYDAPSPVHLVLFALAALAWLGLLALDAGTTAAARWRGRLAAAVGAAAAVVLAMRLLLPKFFLGPLAEIDGQVIGLWFDEILEYRPMLAADRLGETLPLFIFHLGSALLALPFALNRALRSGGFERRAWAWLLLLGLAYVGLSIYQQRWAMFAQYAVVIPYTGLFLAVAGRSRGGGIGAAARRAMAMLAFLFAFPFAGALMHQPASQAASAPPCPLTRMSRWLAAQPELNRESHRILSFINFGPELQYRTRHRVIATPNHRNGASILDAIEALGRLPPVRARAVLERRGVDLVLVCRGSREAADYRRGNGGDTLFAALEQGRPPPWLRPVPLPADLAPSFVLARMVR